MPAIFMFPFEPNWVDGIRYRITYPTKIIKAYDGHEQRIMLRELPIVECEAKYDMGLGAESSWFDSLLWKAQGVGIMMPIWLYATRLTEVISAGQDYIPIPTANPYFGNGDSHVALIDAWDNLKFEMSIITNVSDGNMYLLQPVKEMWDAEITFVVPCRPAKVPAELQLVKPTSIITSATIISKFQETPLIIPRIKSFNAGSVYTEDYTGVPLFYGTEIFLEEPNRRDDLNVFTRRDVFEMDYTTGHTTLVSRAPFTTTTRDFKFLLDGFTDIINFVKWVDRRKGRCVPCWVPSNQEELQIVNDITSGSTQIVVKDIYMEKMFEYPGLYADRPHPLRSNIVIRKTNGQYVPTRIINIASKDSNLNTVTLNVDAINQDIPVNEIALTSFLHHMRLDSDTVELYLHDKHIAEATVKMTETLYDE